jgi:Hemerythrin HHE cation binding domain
MEMSKALLISALAGALLWSAQSASAHRDSLDGSVAVSALRAFDTENVNPVLPYAPAATKTNIKEGAVFAQASGAGAVEASPGTFEIPEGMKIEHDHIHAELVELTQAGGRTGEAAKSVAEVLDPHFAKENEYALPPLGLLVPLSQGKFDADMAGVLKMTDRLEAEMPTMHSEHEDIAAALEDLKEAATAENKPAGVRFAEVLTAHAHEEEEILYPTSLLIGRYVKLRLAQ